MFWESYQTDAAYWVNCNGVSLPNLPEKMDLYHYHERKTDLVKFVCYKVDPLVNMMSQGDLDFNFKT